MKSKQIFIILIALSASCSQDYSPKPKGYFYIQLPEPAYRDLAAYPFFKCSISNQAFVEALKEIPAGMKEKNGTGFNLNYPRFHAQIYCSCFRINKTDFPVFMEESRRMAYIQEKKSKGITEREYSDPDKKIYGLVYEIQGNAACPVQFVISDSVSSFFRGALYFDNADDRDSIAPTLAYINKDIQMMIESFQWKQ